MRHYWLSAFSFLTALLPRVFAAPLKAWDDMLVKHSWYTVPVNWESLGHPPAGTTMNLYIGLKPDREGALIGALSEVSNPRHPRYGIHLSKEQAAELVRPHRETLELVNAWLEHHGIRSPSISMTHGGAWLTVTDVLVSQANQLLGASYQVYRNSKTNDTIIRTVGYALPAELHTHIQTVAPTTYFPPTREMRQIPVIPRRRSFGAAHAQAAPGNLRMARQSGPSPVLTVKPSVLRWMYGTEGYVPDAIDRNKLAVVGFGGEFPSQRDLNRFLNEFDTAAVGTVFRVEQVNGGGYDEESPGEQANADVQYAGALAFPTPLIFYSSGGGQVPGPGDGVLELLNFFLDLDETDFPQTITISYGFGGEKRVPEEYARRLCNLFAALGTRGASVLVASGNAGVGEGPCEDGDGNVQFNPDFPSSCPWVTSIGGTTGLNLEVAASISGGGFSSYFLRPEYQERAVSKYLDDIGDKYEGRYSRLGRGYPDISAQAIDFPVVHNDGAFDMSGTSCAVATVAGVVSLLNDFRISQGKRPLGFLNPWLYEDGLVGLDDVIFGSNPGCGTTGFEARAGWDPVTGLGTPNFRDLQSHLPPDDYLPQIPGP